MQVNLREALKAGGLIADGANGTQLNYLGFGAHLYDLATLEAPDLVEQTHRAYLQAGAHLIETNTFQSNRFHIDLDEKELILLNERAAKLARTQVDGFDGRFVLGAIGPCGRPVEPIGAIPLSELTASVKLQARALEAGGVDGFMLETYVDLDELAAAVEAVKSVSQLPILVSKAFIEDGEAIAEGLPVRAAQRMAEMGADAVGANCIVGPQRMLDLVRAMAEATDLPILALPTPGVPQRVKGSVVYGTTPDYFGKSAARLFEGGASIVGGCCGTTPGHIQALSESANGKIKSLTSHQKAQSSTVKRDPLPTTEPTPLSQKLKSGKFVVAVEMDVPRGLKIEKLLAGARSLKDAGVDIVNISDGARARLRMSPGTVAHLVQRDAQLETVMHFSCRDRNVLAIQADLLGCHALGVRNILAVTGDPTQVGDYPSATSVFDVDAIGLVRILSRFNEGVDLAGNSIGVKCAFTKAVAFNPAPFDPAQELDRLKRKADAGADLIYTQPIYSDEGLQACLDAAEQVKLPILVGVLPLKSHRHAEFMHNEVPGISIPEPLNQAMASASSDEDALKIGIEASVKISRLIRQSAHGLYLMPPFGNASIAKSVLEGMNA